VSGHRWNFRVNRNFRVSPNNPTLYIPLGTPAHKYFLWPGPALGTRSRLAQFESRNCRPRPFHRVLSEFGRGIKLGALAKETYAFDVFRNEVMPDRLKSVPASARLHESNLKPDAKVWEHSVSLGANEGVLNRTALCTPPGKSLPTPPANIGRGLTRLSYNS
jgi:hypothetical protein